MRSNASKPEAAPREKIWRPFFILLKSTPLPYFFILLKIVVELAQSQLALMFPSATQRVMAGDISGAAIGLMVAILFAQALMTAVTQFVGSVTGAKITLSFRKFMIKKTLSLPVPYYDRNMADRLISRTTEDTTMLSDFLAYDIPDLPARIYQVAGTFVILFTYDWRLVALELVMLPLVWGVAVASGKLSFKWTNRIRARLAELTGYLAETLANIPLIKVFVREKKETERGLANIEELYQTNVKNNIIGQVIQFMSNSVELIQTLIAVIGGIYLVSHEYITLDVWIAFYLYSTGLIRTLNTFAVSWQRTKIAQGAANRMAQISTEANEDQGGKLTMEEAAGDLAFQNVTFAYTDEEVLKGLSFTIPQNRVTALVGKSGAGKTTVFGLLERFYTPDAGSITLGGRDIREFDLAGWRKSIGYVPQDAQLFSGTIRDNILYGVGRTVSEEELTAAAKDANAYDFITGLENGFDTEVGERGSKLSGGQRQRIAIARALLKDPKLLLLDEATSSLDAEAAHEVTQALDRLKAGRTTVVIAHELGEVQNADQIVLLDGGAAADAGTHAELLGRSPLYRDLKKPRPAGCGC